MLEYIILFFWGLCVGSFLNVCIYRFPKNGSIIKPRSFCPHCKHPIKWYENIPVFSYLFLRGKCSYCKKPISLKYPIVELITAFLLVALYSKFGLTIYLAKYSILFFLLIVLSFIDIEYHAVPAYLCIAGIIIALIFNAVLSVGLIKEGSNDLKALPLVVSLKGLIFGLGFAYLFKIFGDFFIGIYLNWRKKDSIEGETESLGLGDVDFMGMVGAFLGIKAAILTFFLAPFVAVFYLIFALIFKKSHLIPYLPYLSIGALITFFWGNEIIKFFL